MPTASKSGTLSATRPGGRVHHRPRSRSGPRARPRSSALTQLEAALRALIRFHESHPDWFPPVAVKPSLDPDRELALQRAYRPDAGSGPMPAPVPSAAKA